MQRRSLLECAGVSGEYSGEGDDTGVVVYMRLTLGVELVDDDDELVAVEEEDDLRGSDVELPEPDCWMRVFSQTGDADAELESLIDVSDRSAFISERVVGRRSVLERRDDSALVASALALALALDASRWAPTRAAARVLERAVRA